MVSPHFDVRIVSRGKGRSAVMAAAYQHRAKMTFEREAQLVDFSGKQDLLHEEFVIPADAPEWLRALAANKSPVDLSEIFWNRLENFEKKLDAQLAKDVTLSLPIELSHEQNIALVREFVEHYVLAKGMVADWVYHDAPDNPHVHLMTTLRPLTVDGFGSKRVKAVLPDGRIVYPHWSGGIAEFNVFRDGWFACQNRHLALAGLDIRIDGRSYERQGIDLEPIIRFSAGTRAIERKIQEGRITESQRPKSLELQAERRAENARRIQRRPEIVLDLVSRRKSVFDERDVAEVLNRYVDDASTFRYLLARILQSPVALRLERERIEFSTGMRTPAKYTTRELIRLEAEMVNRADWLAKQTTHGVQEHIQETTFARHSKLSEEQRAAVAHVASGERISAVIGRAGAGKTTMMKVAREIWEAAGYHVVGAALAGKAAEALEKEAGIRSGTICSWERRWSEGRIPLDDKTVFVLDEAGMVSSRQMALLVEAVTEAGAKLVIVGDPDQLQPIEAGAAFRGVVGRIGYTELETIYRQRKDWMRSASVCLARGEIDEALDAYRSHNRLIGSELKAAAVECLIADWSRDYDPTRTTLILAHLRRDVRMLNEKARAKLVERGIVGEGFAFATEEGIRRFAAGDQIVFLKNDGALGVKNGMIGRVREASINRIVAEVGDGERQRQVTVEHRSYQSVDLGYATTIHKSQGATVDSVKVLASLSLDRHLAYVAMTRHRDDLAIYYGQKSFEKAGGLVSILSRVNAKESTLDYISSSFYRQALRFAAGRGMHLMAVARTLVRDRLEWTVRQKQRLNNIVQKLAAISDRMGLTSSLSSRRPSHSIGESTPLVTGISSFSTSVSEAIEERLARDQGLATQWQQICSRFHLVYAEPQAAFRMIDVDGMLKDGNRANDTIAEIASGPERFGPLKGKTGMFARNTDKQDRECALLNAPALARNLVRYLRSRAEVERKYLVEENALRMKASIEIPGLSENATQALGRAREAIDRGDLQAALEPMHAEAPVRRELERVSRLVSERFGERTFLGIAARDENGKTFDKLTSGMTVNQKAEMRAAWSLLRTIQQLAAHERTTLALKQSEALRHSKNQGLSLK
ncbi:conjugal transfer protein TraA [Ensifer adhaerens OV14]|nr:conjugal transfer protein TraA [Ensifer adhaerens OV14]